MMARHMVRRTKQWRGDITGNLSVFWNFGVMSRGRGMEWSRRGAVGSAGEEQPAALVP